MTWPAKYIKVQESLFLLNESYKDILKYLNYTMRNNFKLEFNHIDLANSNNYNYNRLYYS